MNAVSLTPATNAPVFRSRVTTPRLALAMLCIGLTVAVWVGLRGLLNPAGAESRFEWIFAGAASAIAGLVILLRLPRDGR